MHFTVRSTARALLLAAPALVSLWWLDSTPQASQTANTAPPRAQVAAPAPTGGTAPVAQLTEVDARRPRLPEHADQVVDYRISVRLDPKTKEVKGRERLTWRNPSGDAVPDLWFHLYLNAFKNSKSTFFKGSGGQLRGDRMPEDGWGYVDIVSMRLADGTDLTKAYTFEAPDDRNSDDQTVIRVPLPSAVPPGASLTLDIEFVSKLPKVFARTGFKDDFYLVAQWFPKLGVYEPAGTRGRETGGWNCHQFHPNSEFYADFGRFEVDFTVPAAFVVGATGERTARRENGDGTVTYTYGQADVHDFAWTASPDYVEQRHRFSATGDVTREEYRRVAALLDRSEDEVRLSDVEVILLLHPRHVSQASRYLDAAKLGIKWFGLWYGRYPYKTLTVVDPAPGAGGAGGMEYPTFITGGTSFVLGRWPFDRIRAPEGVTVHEFGHQFWYGLVANNEFEEAWLDEGFNSYSTGKIMEIGYGRDTALVDFLGVRVGAVDVIRAQNAGGGFRYDTVRQPSWSYTPGSYSFYSYTKPEILLRTLEGLLGEQTMARVMRTYHERWRFRHPSSDDFYAVANEVSGQDLTWFFEQAVEGTQVLDYEIASVSTRPAAKARGYLEDGGKRSLVQQEKARGDAGDEAGPFESTVLVRRRGEFVAPVEIALKFAGAPPERVTWNGHDRWTRLTFNRPGRLEWAEVDPDRTLVLDSSWLNNARRVEPDTRVARGVATRWLFWMQQIVAGAGW
jgi:hypothetical protein